MPRLDGQEVVLDTTFVTHVSLAVVLVDGYTNAPAFGRIRVLLQERSQEGRVNPSGYCLFLNLPDGLYTLRVESEHYLDEELVLSVPTSPPEQPWVTIFLQPRPAYPFPPGATLIRGLVRDALDHPVAEARVEIVGSNIVNHSVQNGEFVLYFAALRERDVIRVNRQTFVKDPDDQHEPTSLPASPTLLTVRATHLRYGTATTTTEVQEGTTALVWLVYE